MSEKFRRSLAILLTLALVLTVLSVAGCKKKEEPAAEPTPTSDVVKGGTLREFIISPATISPSGAYESEAIYVVGAVFDSLVDFDPLTSELQPAVAESWEANAEATVWTFHLKKGTKFSNGREVVAKDFQYAWERICDPATASDIVYHLYGIKGAQKRAAGEADSIEGIKVIDDYTLEVTMENPYPDFQFVVGHPCLGPVPKEEVDKDSAAYDLMPIGNGPFKLSEPWKADQYIKVVRNDDYYGDKPNIDGIDYLIFKDEQTAFLEFEAKNLDWTGIPAGQLASVRATYGNSPDGYTANPGEQTLTGNQAGIYYLEFNFDNPLLQNKKLREAFSLAINRQAISDALYDGSRTPANGVVAPGVPGYKKEGTFPAAKYDVEASKAALAEAGYPAGAGLPEITLDVNSGSSHESVFQLIQQDLAAVGIKSKIAATEWAVYKEMMGQRKFQVARYGWIWDYPIAENVLYALFYSKSADNESHYNNPAYDAEVTTARTILDDAKRIEGMQKAEEILGADTAVVPIMYYSHMEVFSDRVNDLVLSPMNIPDYVHCWLDPNTP